MPSTNCPYCGKLTDPNLENCPHCQGQLQRVPQTANAPKKSSRQTCPNCHAMVQDGDIICVNCGTNLLTGQKIAEEKVAAASKQKSKLPLIIGVAALAVIVLVGLILLLVLLLGGNPVDKAMRLGEEGRLLEAEDILRGHVGKKPDDERAYFELGRLRWTSNQPGLAAQAFERAAELDPTNRDASMAAVVTVARSPGENLGQAVVALEGVVMHDPNDQEAWQLLGLTRGARDDLEGQVLALEKTVALNAGDIRARLQLGVARALEGDYAAATQELDSALGEQPGNTDLQAALGLVAALQGDSSRATAVLREAADADGDMPGAVCTELGLCLVAQGEYADAARYLERAARQQGGSPEAKFFLAACRRAQDKIQEAISGYEAVSKTDHALAGPAAVRAAEAYLAIDDLDGASDAMDRAKRKGLDSAEFYTVSGRVWEASGDLTAAQEAYARATQVDPQYAPAHLESGLLFLQREMAERALRELELYLKLVDSDARDSRTQEVRGLVEQLKQTEGGEGIPTASIQVEPERRGA